MGLKISKQKSPIRQRLEQKPPESRGPGAPKLPDEANAETAADRRDAVKDGRPDVYDSDPERNLQGEQNVGEGLLSKTEPGEVDGDKRDPRLDREREFESKLKGAETGKEAEKKGDKKGEKAPEPKPLPKTSPAAHIGDTVIYRTQEKGRQHNGTKDHVAIITRDWGSCVNLKVLPDCGAPYDATSQQRIAVSDENAQGWFSVGEKTSYDADVAATKKAATEKKPK